MKTPVWKKTLMLAQAKLRACDMTSTAAEVGLVVTQLEEFFRAQGEMAAQKMVLRKLQNSCVTDRTPDDWAEIHAQQAVLKAAAHRVKDATKALVGDA